MAEVNVICHQTKIFKIYFTWASKYRSYFHSTGMLNYLQTALGWVRMSSPTIQFVSLNPVWFFGFFGFVDCSFWVSPRVSYDVCHTAVLGVNIADPFFPDHGMWWFGMWSEKYMPPKTRWAIKPMFLYHLESLYRPKFLCIKEHLCLPLSQIYWFQRVIM